MILRSVADEKLFVGCGIPLASTRAICTPVIPTCCTGAIVGLHVAAGDGVAPPEIDEKPPMVTVGSEPSEESLVVAESGATVALSDVEPESGGEPGPAAPLGRVAVVAPARAAGLAAGFPEAAEGPAGADGPRPGAKADGAASEGPAGGQLV